MSTLRHSRLIAALLVALGLAAPATGIDSSLTYQGRLSESGAPASGSYDLQFTLQDAGGATIGSPLLKDNVSVADGVALAAIQGLHPKLEAENAAQDAQLLRMAQNASAQAADIDALRRELAALRTLLGEHLLPR